MLLLWVVPAVAAAEPIVVNTTGDGLPREGEESCTGAVGITCTLREAIEQANDEEGADTITFSALRADEHQLTVEESSLPTIFEGVTIEGDSLPGATPGVPALELVPTNMGEEAFTTGFQVEGGVGTRIEGFAIGGFSAGIEVAAGEGSTAEETQICGNYIGTDLSGEAAAANDVGVELWSGDGEQAVETEVGGVDCPGNVISGNVEYGIWDDGIGTTIAANAIGIGAQPSGEILPNGTGIIEKERASNAVIGGIEPSGALANVIAFNEGPGVMIEEGEGAVAVRHDSFFGNGGPAIERAVQEPPAPEITLVRSPAVRELEVEGEVTGLADGEETVEVDIYGSPECDASGAGEGQTFLGTAVVSSDLGFATFQTTLPVEVPADDTVVTATMTSERGATSEFSTCADYEPAPQTFHVTTLEDNAEGGCHSVCSLREAIEVADEFPNRDTIDFDVAGAIKPDEQDLPFIVAPVIINGTTAPGYEEGSPAVEIDGSEAANEGRTQGLTIFPEAPGTTIEGLAITNFQEGIEVDGNHSVLDANVITHNSESGVFVEATAPETAIRRTVLFENGEQLVFSTPNSVPEPVLEAFVPGPSSSTLIVPLTGGEPDHTYAIDVFANAHCEQPGEQGPLEVFLASGEATANDEGEVRAEIAGPALSGINAEVFTATATDLATGTTSQIGHCAYSPIGAEIRSAPPAVTGSPNATFTFAGVTVGHVESFECSLDGSSFTTCASGHEYPGLADGFHVFAVKAINGEGFESAQQNYTWKVKTAAPGASITAAPLSSTTATDATFEFGEAGNGGEATGFECSLDGGGFAPCSSPRSFTGLGTGEHTFAVRTTDEVGNKGAPTAYRWTVTSPPQQTQVLVTTGPTPENGESVVVAPEEGKVLIKLPGSKKFVPLEELKEIPVGAVIDATKGKVRLTSIDPDGTEQSANFFGGVFKVKQREGAGLVVLELLDTTACPAPRSGGAPRLALASSLAARPGSGTAGKLWGSGHGNFRTEGNNGSATVRGTIWLVEDRCNGTTFFRTRRGIVSVRDFTTHKTLPLPAGKTYVAGEG